MTKASETDPQQQLDLLKEVSQQIDTWRDSNRSQLPFRLKHFLDQYSLDKALLCSVSGESDKCQATADWV